MKICKDRGCLYSGDPQPLSSFHKDRSRKDGCINRCKTCQKKRDATRYRRDRTKLIAYQKQYQRKNYDKVRTRALKYRRAHPEKQLWMDARRRAARAGIPFSIAEVDVVIPTHCPLLGVKLSVRTDGKQGGGPCSPSLDRIVPKKGYVPGNVWVISWKANRLKGEVMPNELVSFAKAILRLFGKK